MKYPMYYLSGRQLHEVDRGYVHRICLPMPAEEPEDLLAWARDHLAIRRPLVRAAEADEITVAVTAGGTGLEGVFGGIVHQQTPRVERLLTIEVVVIECEVCGHDLPRGRSKRQWPAGVELAGGATHPKGFKPSKRS